MHRVRHVFAWLGGVTFIAICLLVIAGLVIRARTVTELERDIFETRSSATATPETYGVPYRAFHVASGGRSLNAWTVDAGPGTPALLLFHGNGQTIHDLARVQAYLFRHHVSSMSFDYSGFGASTGKPTIRNLDHDAVAAWGAFARWTGNAHAGFALGYSLGTGVLLHNVHAFAPRPLGVIVYGAFSSAKQLVAYIGPGLPGWLVAIMPDLWDNVEAAQTLREPLLVVAGMDDTNVPPDMGRRIALFAQAADSRSAFVQVPNVGHAGIVSHMDQVWPPILAFVHELTTPGRAPGAGDKAPATTSRPAPSMSSARR